MEPPVLDDEDFSLAQKTLAIFSDKYHVAVGPTLVRLTFGEATGGGAVYRTAVVMERSKAEDLVAVLSRLIEEANEIAERINAG